MASQGGGHVKLVQVLYRSMLRRAAGRDLRALMAEGVPFRLPPDLAPLCGSQVYARCGGVRAPDASGPTHLPAHPPAPHSPVQATCVRARACVRAACECEPSPQLSRTRALPACARGIAPQVLPARRRNGQVFSPGPGPIATEHDVRGMVRQGFRRELEEGEEMQERVEAAFEGLRRLDALEEVTTPGPSRRTGRPAAARAGRGLGMGGRVGRVRCVRV
jgi:hypothetical protein